MDSSSSSKVTVEYFDPSGVFPLLSLGLFSRLPLRNLHWKSPSRPFRSIASLHVDLVQADQTQSVPFVTAATPDELSRVKSFESSNSGQDDLSRTRSRTRDPSEQKSTSDAGAGTFKRPIKERRHQIPGLRQTPYLKVYLLRCDDGEIYKASSRRLIREWIKEHTPGSNNTSSANKEEKHDAFEWIIVHVVLPNTPAALQPGWSSSSSSGVANVPERPQNASRWPGRGSSTILEKIRADFNGSSKSSTDRVAQIRLHQTDVPPHLLPLPLATSVAVQPRSTRDEQEDQETAWSDLIVKLKALILTSFDLRVRQYEEDIYEKDAQRNLPGWNFCTFFVLKEGLARGFESVGLVEDALAKYDELAMGLDDIVRGQAIKAEDEDPGAAFLSYTEDLRYQVETIRTKASPSNDDRRTESTTKGTGHPDYVELPLSSSNKQYRDLILANNISIFDFRCYLFARQKTLLLRLGNAHSSAAGLTLKLKAHSLNEKSDHDTHNAHNPDDAENLLTLSEVCTRGADFITSVARVMRSDLQAAYRLHMIGRNRAAKNEPAVDNVAGILGEKEEIEHVIDNVVQNWTFDVSQQLLAETSSRALPVSSPSIAETNLSGSKEIMAQGQESKVVIPEPKTMMHPARVSSRQLNPNLGASEHSPATPVSEEQRSQHRLAPPGFEPQLKPGMEELASSRADLYLLSRNAVQHLGEQRGWLKMHPPRESESQLEEVDLSDAAVASSPLTHRNEPETTSGRCGLTNPVLQVAVQSKSSFYFLYESLTDTMLRHYTVANRTSAVQRSMTDLALLKFALEDYATAATYFSRLVPFYAKLGWHMVEMSLLTAYATCLKKLGRKEEYVRIIIELLGKAAVEEKEKVTRGIVSPRAVYGDWWGDEAVSLQGYLPDLLSYAKELPSETVIPVNKLFGEVEVSSYPQHHEDRDGFSLQINVRHLLAEDLALDGFKIRLVGKSHGQTRDIWLRSMKPLIMSRGLMSFCVETNAVIPGPFVVDKIVMEAPNIRFVHQTHPDTPNTLTTIPRISTGDIKDTQVLCYARPESFEAKLGFQRDQNLDEFRSLEIILSTGWNDVKHGQLRLRSATAGLRIRTADVEVLAGALNISHSAQPGVISFSGLSAGATVKLDVPYSLERDRPELLIKIEVTYTTLHGDFLYSTIENVSVVLPLGVNVQESFTRDTMFSRFTVSTATAIPLRVLSSKLRGPVEYNIESGGVETCNLLVFPKQPASLVYQIGRRIGHEAEREKQFLALSIEYRRLDEEISDALTESFEGALESSPIRALSRLLLSTLLTRFLNNLTIVDYEAIALFGTIRIPTYPAMRWFDLLTSLHPSHRQPLERWLETWHHNHDTISLASAATVARSRTIVIPVEIPQVRIVHTVELHLPNLLSSRSSVDSPALVGAMIPSELRIQHTRMWDSPSGESHAEAFDFVYEIHGNNDHWLVGGQKRFAFSAKENERLTFPVMLLPLQPGHLLLPHVEIYAARPGHTKTPPNEAANGASLSQRGSDRGSSSLTTSGQSEISMPPSTGKAHLQASDALSSPSISCETDYRSRARTILVISNVKSSTVSLEPGITSGVAQLVDADRRSTKVIACYVVRGAGIIHD